MDFMSVSLKDGRSLRTFHVIDDYNREYLTIDVDFSLQTKRVIRSLKKLLSGEENLTQSVVIMALNI
jgi:putative transposase